MLKHELDSAEEQIEKSIQDYIVEERRKTCEMMQKKLPREIRDMVYEVFKFTYGRVCVKQYLHLLGRYNPRIVQEPCTAEWRCVSRHCSREVHFEKEVVDTIWNGVCSEWMSSRANQATTKELNERLLRVSEIDLWQHYSLIGLFLDLNIPDLGIAPAAMVRYATITLPHLFPVDGVDSILGHLKPLLRLEW
jgi:hypothetical protein